MAKVITNRIICVLFPLIFVHVINVTCSRREDVQKLHEQLLQNYNRDIRPNDNQSQPQILSLAFNLFALQEFDDKYGKLVILGLFSLFWDDERIAWDPTQHGNTTSLQILQTKVWVPTLFVAKPFEDIKRIGHDYITVRFDFDGEAYWEVPDLLEISCTANVAYYPFDRHVCEIYLIPFGFIPEEIELHLPLDTMTKNDFIENGIWEILSTRLVVITNEIETYVKMELRFQRRPLFTIINLFLPIYVVNILNIFIFILPPEPGERSAFGVTILLALAVFLSTISDKLPSSSQPHIARICSYLLMRLIVSALSMVFAMCGQKMYYQTEDKPIPEWLKRLLSTCSRKKIQNTRDRSKNVKDISDSYENGRRQINEGTFVYDSDNRVYHQPNGKFLTNREHRQLSDLRLNLRHTDTIAPDYPQSPSGNYDGNPKDKDTNLCWEDIARWFDRFCLILFIVLNASIMVCEILDVVFYLREDV